MPETVTSTPAAAMAPTHRTSAPLHQRTTRTERATNATATTYKPETCKPETYKPETYKPERNTYRTVKPMPELCRTARHLAATIARQQQRRAGRTETQATMLAPLIGQLARAGYEQLTADIDELRSIATPAMRTPARPAAHTIERTVTDAVVNAAAFHTANLRRSAALLNTLAGYTACPVSATKAAADQ